MANRKTVKTAPAESTDDIKKNPPPSGRKKAKEASGEITSPKKQKKAKETVEEVAPHTEQSAKETVEEVAPPTEQREENIEDLIQKLNRLGKALFAEKNSIKHYSQQGLSQYYDRNYHYIKYSNQQMRVLLDKILSGITALAEEDDITSAYERFKQTASIVNYYKVGMGRYIFADKETAQNIDAFANASISLFARTRKTRPDIYLDVVQTTSLWTSSWSSKTFIDSALDAFRTIEKMEDEQTREELILKIAKTSVSALPHILGFSDKDPDIKSRRERNKLADCLMDVVETAFTLHRPGNATDYPKQALVLHSDHKDFSNTLRNDVIIKVNFYLWSPEQQARPLGRLAIVQEKAVRAITGGRTYAYIRVGSKTNNKGEDCEGWTQVSLSPPKYSITQHHYKSICGNLSAEELVDFFNHARINYVNNTPRNSYTREFFISSSYDTDVSACHYFTKVVSDILLDGVGRSHHNKDVYYLPKNPALSNGSDLQTSMKIYGSTGEAYTNSLERMDCFESLKKIRLTYLELSKFFHKRRSGDLDQQNDSLSTQVHRPLCPPPTRNTCKTPGL